jgi:hypothetical protein
VALLTLGLHKRQGICGPAELLYAVNSLPSVSAYRNYVFHQCTSVGELESVLGRVVT